MSVGPDGDTSVKKHYSMGRASWEIAHVMPDGKTVYYLDIGGSFLNAEGQVTSEIMPDFLHLSPKGYRLWAEAMEPMLWSLLEAK